MLGDGFDFVDARNVELGGITLFPNGLCGFLRDYAEFGKRLTCIGLNFEPDAEFGFGRPDGDHFWSGIARDHGHILFWRPVCRAAGLG
ncbi:hypothetical protein D3C87_2001730 [compost metagenome]